MATDAPVPAGAAVNATSAAATDAAPSPVAHKHQSESGAGTDSSGSDVDSSSLVRKHGGPSSDDDTLDLVQLILPFYVPRFFTVGSNLFSEPILPLLALDDLGGSDAGIGVALAAVGVGRLIANVPSGSFVTRFGAKCGIVFALSLEIVAALLAATSPNMTVLVLSRLVFGISQGLLEVSQQVFLSARVATHRRGRVSSLFGGLRRIASFVAPVLGGLLAFGVGNRWAMAGQALWSGVALAFAAIFMPVTKSLVNAHKREESATAPLAEVEVATPARRASCVNDVAFLRVLRKYAKVYMLVGTFAGILLCVRQSRPLLFPLAGKAVGMTQKDIGAMLSAGYLCDSSLFWLSGILMDRYGRKVSGFIATMIMGAGFLVLGFGSNYTVAVVVAVCVAGLGNSLSSGLVFTLGGDLAPANKDRSTFVGVYRLIVDVGQLVGPLLAGVLVELFSISIGAFAVAFLAAFAMGWICIMMPETLRKGPKDGDEALGSESDSESRSGRDSGSDHEETQQPLSAVTIELPLADGATKVEEAEADAASLLSHSSDSDHADGMPAPAADGDEGPDHEAMAATAMDGIEVVVVATDEPGRPTSDDVSGADTAATHSPYEVDVGAGSTSALAPEAGAAPSGPRADDGGKSDDLDQAAEAAESGGDVEVTAEPEADEAVETVAATPPAAAAVAMEGGLDT